MPGKKGLEAFIKKNQKKEKKPLVTKTEEATAAATAGDTKAHDAEVGQTQAKSDKNAPANQATKGEDSSDEEEEENQVLRVGNIKEKKDVVSKNKTGDENKKGYGLDDGMAGGDPVASLMSKGTDKSKISGAFSTTKKTADSIQFSGKPKFGRKKNLKFGDSFKAGLDDIDDESGPMKQETSKATGGSGADGHREFINLSSAARGGMTGASEEQKESRPIAVKPTFKGKLNLTKTGGGGTNDDQNEGVVKTYDYGVTFKSASTGGDREARPEGSTVEGRKDKRHGGHKGRQHFGAENNGDDDEGFEIVRNVKDKKKMRANDDSSSEEEDTRTFGGRMRGGARVEQRAARGTRGGFDRPSRGGMFSNEPDL